MRLTLRTLLAYLDNTLEPKDAEALRLKLSESGFATQLVARIRASLVNPNLSAPSPDAVSPIDEANVISEYLDSTLSPEQIAEVEKACLESDPHLAEAAACHQILTMVLGKPAEVSEALRDRIYQLPDRSIEEMPTAVPGSFSGLSLPAADNLSGLGVDADSETQATSEPILQSSAGPVTPVGAGDSGVSDAPKRLREAAAKEPDSLRRARIAAEDMYGGSIRTSRITPWLVSLALAGVFLFALGKVLAPLMSGPVAKNEEKISDVVPDVKVDDPPADAAASDEDATIDSAGDEVPAEEILVPAAKAPIMETVGTPGVEIKSSEEADVIELPMPMPKPAGQPEKADVADAEPNGDTSEPESKPDSNLDMAETLAPPAATVTADSETPDAGPDTATGDAMAAATDATDVPPAAKDMAKDVAAENMAAGDVAADAAALAAAADLKEDDIPVAKSLSENTILFAALTTEENFANAKWTLVEKDMAVSQRATLINSPKFRSELVIDTRAAITLVDATKANFVAPAKGGADAAGNDASKKAMAGLNIDYGKVLIKARQDDLVLPLVIGGHELTLQLPMENTTVAVEVRWLRRPGFDPFLDKNHTPIARVVVIADPAGLAGEAIVTTPNGDETLQSDQQWMKRGDDPAQVLDVPEPLTWATDPDDGGSILDQSARDNLVALLAQPQPLALSLREATSFRRAEVAALASQLMLHLGHADVYFGTDGILYQSKQRSYWAEHYKTLRGGVDHSASFAKLVNDQVRQIDSANAKDVMRLLVGYSQSQLVEGGDEELVEKLDSTSMAVRVLATENLREITGTTLNFWAGEDNAVRRVPSIKKWQARLRKGDIVRKGEAQ